MEGSRGMSEKTLKTLVGALVVVAGLWAVAALFSNQEDGRRNAAGDVATFFDDISEVSVTSVRMNGPDYNSELSGGVDDWAVNGYQADSATVFRFWAAMLTLDVGDLAASNPDNHDRMGVSAAAGWSIEFDLDGVTKTMLVGDTGPRSSTNYVRLPDEDEVYILEGDLRTHIRRLPNEWRSKTVARVDTAAVTRVEIQRDTDEYALVRGDSLWTFDDGSETNSSAVNGVMSELANLLAVGFLEEGDSLEVMDQGAITTAYDQSGNVLAIVTIGTGDSDRWARSAGDEVIYRIGLYRVDRIAPKLESIEPSS